MDATRHTPPLTPAEAEALETRLVANATDPLATYHSYRAAALVQLLLSRPGLPPDIAFKLAYIVQQFKTAYERLAT